MYRGTKKYQLLFRQFSPNMWNFTGRGLIFPEITGLEDLLANKESACTSQRDIYTLADNDVLLEGNQEHDQVWSSWLEQYLSRFFFVLR